MKGESVGWICSDLVRIRTGRDSRLLDARTEHVYFCRVYFEIFKGRQDTRVRYGFKTGGCNFAGNDFARKSDESNSESVKLSRDSEINDTYRALSPGLLDVPSRDNNLTLFSQPSS